MNRSCPMNETYLVYYLYFPQVIEKKTSFQILVILMKTYGIINASGDWCISQIRRCMLVDFMIMFSTVECNIEICDSISRLLHTGVSWRSTSHRFRQFRDPCPQNHPSLATWFKWSCCQS